MFIISKHVCFTSKAGYWTNWDFDLTCVQNANLKEETIQYQTAYTVEKYWTFKTNTDNNIWWFKKLISWYITNAFFPFQTHETKKDFPSACLFTCLHISWVWLDKLVVMLVVFQTCVLPSAGRPKQRQLPGHDWSMFHLSLLFCYILICQPLCYKCDK